MYHPLPLSQAARHQNNYRQWKEPLCTVFMVLCCLLPE